MLVKINLVTLFVTDQDRALNFYTEVLRFEARVDRPGVGGGRIVSVGLEGQDLEIVLWPGTPGTPLHEEGYIPGVCIIETGDLKSEVEHLKSIGVEFEPEIDMNLPAAFVAVLRDPDGNRLMLRESRS
jgi:catechol 2,3-dioxygenase-like lactoylglutathione lyase family enzyme